MMSKWLLISCYLLTVIVVAVASRIEYLNVKSDFFLPRHAHGGRPWEIPELDLVMERSDDLIYERRQNSAAAVAIENGSKPAEVTFGAPYSAAEQRTLDSMKNLHASHTNLRWWVSSFGIAQYFIAPVALCAAVICIVCLGSWGVKSSAALCAGLNAISIILMLTRNYWFA
jgi:hypothetical protein